jgi:hypothetical protein
VYDGVQFESLSIDLPIDLLEMVSSLTCIAQARHRCQVDVEGCYVHTEKLSRGLVLLPESPSQYHELGIYQLYHSGPERPCPYQGPSIGKDVNDLPAVSIMS